MQIECCQGDGSITSARLESYGVWSTATAAATKNRGYLEVRSTLPAKVFFVKDRSFSVL